MRNETLKKNVIFVSVYFSFITHTITKLETKNMSLMIVCKLTNQQLKN
jgi:hypothetical protein